MLVSAVTVAKSAQTLDLSPCINRDVVKPDVLRVSGIACQQLQYEDNSAKYSCSRRLCAVFKTACQTLS